MFPLLLLAQAAASSAPAGEPVVPIDFDLKTVSPAPRGDEIVVTARRRDDQRVPVLDRFVAEEGLPKAETGLFGKVRAGVEVEAKALGGGTVSNRAMVKFKVPF